MLTTRGGVTVIADLTALGYDTRWTVMGAADVGAKHQRDRMWILAYSKCEGLERHGQVRQPEVTWSGSGSSLAYTENQRDVWRNWKLGFVEQEHDSGRGTTNRSRKWWEAEPNVGRVANGVAARVDRLKAIGNGQVPLCAAEAWRLLTGNLTNKSQTSSWN